MNLTPFEWIVELYHESPLKVKYLLGSIVVLLFLCLLTLTVLVSLRMKLYNRRNKTSFLRAKYEELLITLLYLDEEDFDYQVQKDEIVNELKIAIKSKAERNIIKDLLIGLLRDISGDMATQIQELFHELGLVKYSLKKLKSRKWYIKIQGIRELTEMQERSIQGYVFGLVNHNNTLLRSEAQLTMVRLFEYGGLGFLIDLKYPVSEWQQLQLMASIQNNVEFVLPQIKDLLKSKNITVIQFSLKLVQFFNHIIEPEEIKRLIKHRDPQIRKQTIDIIGEMGLFDMKPYLKESYVALTKEGKLSVINTLAQLGSEEDVTFLTASSEDVDFKISLQAMLALKDLLTQEEFKKEMGSLHVKNERALEFVMDQVC